MLNPELMPIKSCAETVMQMTKISVCTSARLHMGFFDLNGGLGRKFGGIGLALDAPKLALIASAGNTSEPLLITALGDANAPVVAKVTKIASQMMTQLKIKAPLHLHVEQHIAEHAGLGSGTQLALAIGSAISHLYHLNLSTLQIAQLAGRGGRSGIGIAAFNYGGVLIDGGRAVEVTTTSKLPPLLARYDFPDAWRVLLILDSSFPGIHGEEERTSFNQLPEFSANLAAHLCRHVLMQAMPALVERDLTAFGHSIQELQMHVGDYFSPAQGGRYASPLVANVLQHLQHMGVACFGQSSWGPTGFAVFETDAVAQEHLQQLQSKFTDSTLSWMVCGARNHSAIIKSLPLKKA
jgi:beta-ribofuranosylaminobenzene 5'-phosphate synthase